MDYNKFKISAIHQWDRLSSKEIFNFIQEVIRQGENWFPSLGTRQYFGTTVAKLLAELGHPPMFVDEDIRRDSVVIRSGVEAGIIIFDRVAVAMKKVKHEKRS